MSEGPDDWGDLDALPDEGDAPAPAEGLAARLLADCAAQPLNDVGNGHRFALHFADRAMWVARVGWHVWDGCRWCEDPDTIELRRLAQTMGGRIVAEIPHVPAPAPVRAAEIVAADLPPDLLARARAARTPAAIAALRGIDPELAAVAEALAWRARVAREWRGHARGSGNSGKIDAMLQEASVRLSRPVEALDADALWVNTRSGVLAFARDDAGRASLRLLPHDRGQWLTKLAPVNWRRDAPAPRFRAFLDRVQPGEAMQGFLQRWFGLSLTGLTGEQKLAFFHGGGANGKSVLVDVIARILGDYAATAKVESLTGKNRRGGGDATPDLMPLVGARFVRASEPEMGAQLQEGTIKELTGGEPIMVRSLHANFITVSPKFKLTISGNHKPEVRGSDDGIWRRLLLVPFAVQIPAAERDHRLVEKLWEERDGIFAWAVEGLLDYLEVGLAEPAEVLDATAEFREESNPVASFLLQACVVTGRAEDSLSARELVEACNFWLVEQGLSEWRPRTISLRLAEMSRRWRAPDTGASFAPRKTATRNAYDGIRFADLFAARFRDAPRDQRGRPLSGRQATDVEP